MTAVTYAPLAGPAPDGYAAGMRANQICRVSLAIIGTALLWVPFRLLVQNREFVATVLVVDVAIINLFTIINASLWPNDHWDDWWDGQGLCDLEVYVTVPLHTLYAACIFAIMRNLAHRLRLRRMGELTKREKRRETVLQAVILFTVPAIQLVCMWFVQTQRYLIGGVLGCFASYDDDVLKIIVFNAPPALFAVFTVPFAYLTWKRFRQASKSTRAALQANTEASSRSHRARKRLYLMALSIITPYVPLQIAFLVYNAKTTQLHDYSLQQVHSGSSAYPWNAVTFVPYWMINFVAMNQPYVAIVTAIPIVWFFGMTKEAIETYRKFLCRLGLSKCFPRLKDPYEPDRPRSVIEPGRISRLSTSRYAITSIGSSHTGAGVRHSGLPNVHHQAIITSDGPYIPPRHSSASGPSIPPRGSSLEGGILKRVQFAVKMPSIQSLRSLGKKKPKHESASGAIGDVEQMIPLQDLGTGALPRTPGPGSAASPQVPLTPFGPLTGEHGGGSVSTHDMCSSPFGELGTRSQSANSLWPGLLGHLRGSSSSQRPVSEHFAGDAEA
ncbi:hypothetical protein JX266_010969 [Neoarthrinium moseri]|nr:hypothetical protein JX266_010969 [Neoarthrinium moseri]